MPGKSPYKSVGGFARFGKDKPLKTKNFGAQGRNRTTDTVIFSHSHCVAVKRKEKHGTWGALPPSLASR